MAIEESPFSDLLCEIIDNRGKTCPTAAEGIPLIATNCIRNELLYPAYEKVRFVSPGTYATWFRGHPQPGDILFVNKATPGRVCLVPDPVDFCIAQDMVAIRADPRKIYPRYLFAALRSPTAQEKIAQMHVGTLIPHFKKGDFDKLLLPVPNRAIQEFIGDTYFELSAKIDLNRRMSETLEAMARALFKSWFVDFVPVRAKAEGRGPGLPEHLADLFPDSFEESELGEIPKLWRAVPLPELIEVNPTRPLRKGEVAPYLDMANMPTQGHSPNEVVVRPFGSGTRFINGDTLVARITPCLENGKTAFVDFLERGQVGWGSTEYIVLRPKPPLPEEFAYCLARSEGFREFAIQSMTGSSGRQRVPAESLSHYLFVAGPPQITERFGMVVRPLFERASSAANESRTLAALRDALLPKLISGELPVKDAERFLVD